mgnify:FL=1
MQEDILFNNLTVRETLTFAALMRLQREMPKAEKLAMVDKVIELLDLHICQNTRIGSQFERGVSGGERKRVSIGVELLGNPSIIFMDEPTSGAPILCFFLR